MQSWSLFLTGEHLCPNWRAVHETVYALLFEPLQRDAAVSRRVDRLHLDLVACLEASGQRDMQRGAHDGVFRLHFML